MANLTVGRNLRIERLPSSGTITGLAKNSTTFYAGSFVCLDISTGYINKAADTANFVWQGLCVRQVAGDTTASPVPEVEIVTGNFILRNYDVVGTSAVTHQGDLVYCLDDNILDLTSSSNLKAMGRIIRWRTGTKCDVYVFTPQESAAS